ncbi:MAG: sce7726 family protein [Chloroflexi bacterium]|nr:sce7726 family protein [Chloroflexota bacterium]
MKQTTQQRGSNSRPAILLDESIRSALVSRRLHRHVSHPETLVIHELGLAHAKSRIDLATLNGVIHGYEIKGTQDSLDRLPSQLDTYSQTLQKLTMVVASRHVERVVDLSPQWSGIWEVSVGPRGGVRFNVVREGRRNPRVEKFLLAHLLWRDEAQLALARCGATKAELRAPRAELYRLLVGHLSERELFAVIKKSMMQRRTWRDHS